MTSKSSIDSCATCMNLLTDAVLTPQKIEIGLIVCPESFKKALKDPKLAEIKNVFPPLAAQTHPKSNNTWEITFLASTVIKSVKNHRIWSEEIKWPDPWISKVQMKTLKMSLSRLLSGTYIHQTRWLPDNNSPTYSRILPLKTIINLRDRSRK